MVKRGHRLGSGPGITAESGRGSRRYRVLLRKKGRACDVEMTEAGAEPRIVMAFDTEGEAWDWINEQQPVNRFAAGLAKDEPGKPAARLSSDDLIRLGELAVAELEHRGYDVRGKSADEIKKILRFPAPKARPRGRELP
jgi:hypothetical protein